MNPSPARVDPEQVLEVEILPQRRVQDLDGDRHEGPALGAGLGPQAAAPHVIVVRQVNIKH